MDICNEDSKEEYVIDEISLYINYFNKKMKVISSKKTIRQQSKFSSQKENCWSFHKSACGWNRWILLGWMPLFLLKHHPFWYIVINLWLIIMSYKIDKRPTCTLSFTVFYVVLLECAPKTYLQSLQIARVAVTFCILTMIILN